MEKLLNALKDEKSTAVMITELIEELEDMCPVDIEAALDEIRRSAEADAWLRRYYRRKIKKLEEER